MKIWFQNRRARERREKVVKPEEPKRVQEVGGFVQIVRQHPGFYNFVGTPPVAVLPEQQGHGQYLGGVYGAPGFSQDRCGDVKKCE